MKTLFSLFLAASVTLACSGPPEVSQVSTGLTPNDESSIRALIAEWDRSWVANDHAATVALFTDDYVEARATAIEGPQAAQELYEGFAITYTAVTSTVRRLEGVGSLAYAWVSLDSRYTRDSGERLHQVGNGLWVLKKGADGQWRFSASAFGSSSTAESTEGG